MAASSSSSSAPVRVHPSVVEFALISNSGGSPQPVNLSTTLTITYDAPSKGTSGTPVNLLAFSVRSSSPDMIKVKGGWGQLLSPGESTVVKLTLRRGATSFGEGVDLRLWIAYEILAVDAATVSAGDDDWDLLHKWQEQCKLRSSGELLSSRSASASTSSVLWKGRNFDLLNSSSIVVPCRMSIVRSARTAEVDLLHDQVRLKKAQLTELQNACDALVEQGSDVISKLKHGPTKKHCRSEEVHKGSETLKQKIVQWTAEMEWMEVVGMLLVMSSTALLVISL